MAKAKRVAPEVKMVIGSTPKTKFRGNPDIFGRLVEDHDRHRALLAMIESGKADEATTKKLFREFAKEASSHAAAEEQALWSVILKTPETTEDARHAVSEHKILDDMLADLAARDVKTKEWKKRFKKMHEKYLHHIREEEQEQFLASEKHLSKKDIINLRKIFSQRKKIEKAELKIKKKIKLKAL